MLKNNNTQILKYGITILKRYFMLFLCIILLSLIMDVIGMRALLSYLLFAVLIILVDSLIKGRCLANIITSIGTLGFSMTSFVEMGHAFLFNDRLDGSTFFILFETNMSESKEFLLSAFSSSQLLMIAVLLFMLLFFSGAILLSKAPREYFTFSWLNIKYKLVFILGSLGLLYYLRTSLFVYLTVQALNVYNVEKDALKLMVADKCGGEFEGVVHRDKDKDEVYVLVIGESTSRRCMGIYDYYRMTTPLLNQMRDKLYIYRDVVSPHTHTIAALDKVLTMRSFKDTVALCEGSVIQLFNKAGFKTYWISNQKPIGLYESTVTALSQSADHRTFTNASNGQLDGVLLSPFKKALAESDKKKLIIVHLMGTHLQYSKRYSSEYNLFKTKPKTKFNYPKAWQTINEYDNAVLYNDYVLKSLIAQLKNVDAISALLYFSDHGEEVFHEKEFAMHAETNETKDMYDIPFVLWGSEAFLEKNTLVFDTERQYSTEDLIYSIADLAGIGFKQFDARRSVFNSSFRETKRYITGRREYDEVFEKSKN